MDLFAKNAAFKFTNLGSSSVSAVTAGSRLQLLHEPWLPRIARAVAKVDPDSPPCAIWCNARERKRALLSTNSQRLRRLDEGAFPLVVVVTRGVDLGGGGHLEQDSVAASPLIETENCTCHEQHRLRTPSSLARTE
mmetsp:Transcript_84138/g.167919  ORF Transcript_84138/g.167919 Transcript_84138/m.167919 type:complete len:136 (-) Transcript_84138:1154-1561(-)